ncbi:MAG: DUF3108 domain-containing protein [Bacteroidales bacterium]|nr:DUF3108 domain-containing protein [Bacteroidales bacterium]
MMRLARISLLLFTSIISFMVEASIPTYTNEHLQYRVTYKWGFIQKKAGSAEITLRRDSTEFSAILTARTQPWADHIFMVRDTLKGTMRLSDMAPTQYIKATHEDGVYRHDVINYTYNPDNTITAKSKRYKKQKNTPAERSDTVLKAPMPGTDMLSVYYLVRRLPFESMKVGTVAYAKIFSGKKIENLAVEYAGLETVKLDGVKYQCYRINFTFSSERLKNSSAPMRAWISTEGNRIPIKLEGELPIGKIQVLWEGKQ